MGRIDKFQPAAKWLQYKPHPLNDGYNQWSESHRSKTIAHQALQGRHHSTKRDVVLHHNATLNISHRKIVPPCSRRWKSSGNWQLIYSRNSLPGSGFWNAYRYFTTCPVVRSNWSSNYSRRTSNEKLCCPVTAKKMKKNGNTNMWGVMNTVPTTAVTIYFPKLQIIGAAICVAVVSYNLTGTEKIKCCWKPEYVEDSEDQEWHSWKNNKCLDFTDDLCSNLHKVYQDERCEIWW
jgi:hypothetical protein